MVQTDAHIPSFDATIRTLRQAWQAHQLHSSLRGSGVWSILWGILAAVVGAIMLEESGLNAILIGIGVFLVGTGIAAWAAPGPLTQRLDAVALLLVGAWNIVTSLGGGSEQMVWIGAGVIQIVWAIQRFAKLGRFAEVRRVPKPLIKRVAQLVQETQKARAANDPQIVEFQADGKRWKARLLPDLVVAVAGNAQEVRFAAPDDVEIAVAPEADMQKKWVGATIQIGYDKWPGTISTATVGRYQAWRDAGAAPAEESPVPEAADERATPAAQPVEQAVTPPTAVSPAPGPSAPPVERAAAETERTARWPFAAGLLNLTGLGLGYLYMRRWVRWIVYGLLTAGACLGVLLLASLVSAAAGAALGLLVLWGVWMAFDGWRVARKAASGLAVRRRWIPVAIALVVLLIEAAGFAAYRGLGYREFIRGRTAYEMGEADQACSHLGLAQGLFALSGGDYVRQADKLRQGCDVANAAANLRKEGSYEEALQVLQDSGGLEGENVSPIVEAAYRETVTELAGDSGEEGQTLIREAWEQACTRHLPPTTQAVGLFGDAPAKAWYGGRELDLPDEMVADRPGAFRYAVCLNDQVDVVQTCRYNIGTVERQRLQWRIQVRDTLTGRAIDSEIFEGGAPKSCPAVWTFIGSSRKGTLKGAKPDQGEIVAWIATIMGADLPAAAAAVDLPTPAPTPDPDATPTPEIPDEPVTLSLYRFSFGDQIEPLQEMVYEYQDQRPNVEIEIVEVRDPDQFEAALAAGQADIVLRNTNTIAGWTSEGYLAPLTAHTDKAWLRERYIDPAVDAVLYQDQVYALPLNTVSMALIYNRDLISEEDLPASTDELLARAREWTETEYYFVYYAPLLYYSAAWFHGGGAWYVNDACQPNLDNPAGVAGAELIAAFRQIMPPELDYVTAGNLFASGEVPIILGGPWDLIRAQEIDYGVAPLPVVSATGAPAAPYVEFEGWMLTAAAAEREVDAVAWDVIRFLSGHDAQLRLAQTNYLAPTLRSVVEDEQLESALAVFVEQAEHGYPAPSAECMDKVFRTLDKALRDIWGGADPAETMAEVQQELEDRLE